MSAPNSPGGSPASGSKTPMLIGGVVFVIIIALAIYYFMSGSSTPAPSTSSPTQESSSMGTPPPPPVTGASTTSPSYNTSSASAYIGPSSGTDYPGNDLGNWSNADPNFCADKCNNTAGCVGFVVSSTGQGCFAKSAFANPVPSTTSNTYTKQDVILPDAASKYQAPVIGHYVGNELGSYANIDPNFCATKCNEVTGCVAFETTPTGCTVKSSLTSPIDATQTGTKTYAKIGASAVAPPPVAPAPVSVAPSPVPSAVFQVPAPSPPPSGKYWGPQTGIDYPGNDISFTANSNADNCATMCDANQQCLGYVLATDQQGCWLKSKFANPTASNTRTASVKPGQPSPPGLAQAAPPPPASASYYRANKYTDYYGNDLGYSANSDVNACAALCNGKPNCMGFLIGLDQPGCFLKSSMPNPSVNNGRVAYVKNGLPAPPAAGFFSFLF